MHCQPAAVQLPAQRAGVHVHEGNSLCRPHAGTYRGFDHCAMVSELRSSCPPFLHVTMGSSDGDVPLEAVFATSPSPDSAVDWKSGSISEVIFSSGTESSPKAVMHSE